MTARSFRDLAAVASIVLVLWACVFALGVLSNAPAVLR